MISDGTSWHLMRQSSSGSSYFGDFYLTVDVSGGPTATSYPVNYQATAPDLTGADNVQYKTNKIVLRYILAGSFTMGNTTVGYTPEHPVTLTQGFWAGVFEVTQQQWMHVMGSYPTGTQNYQNAAAGNTMPMHQVSWEDARGTAGGGYDWPNSGNAVLSTSFIGKLRSKTGLGFDLPTEAQWEYSTRAGTSSLWSYGDAENGNYMWYSVNNTPAGTKEVGAKLPNPWGLYDVHGNVWEWCLDWYLNPYSASPTDDPVGALGGSSRVVRGGYWGFDSSITRSARRGIDTPDGRRNNLGLRLFLPRSP